MSRFTKTLKITEAVLEAYAEGFNMADVAELVGVSKATVQRILHDHGASRPRGKRPHKEIDMNKDIHHLKAPEHTEAPRTKTIACPKCGQSEHLFSSRFCCSCGTALETHKDRAKRALENLRRLALKAAGDANSALVMNDYGIVMDVVNDMDD